MRISQLQPILYDIPFFKTVDERELLLGVIGALVLRRISLSRASEIMGMEKEAFFGLLDVMQVEFSYLYNSDIEMERKW